MNKNLMGVFLLCLPCFGYIILVLTFNWIRLGLSGKKSYYGSGSFKTKKNQQMKEKKKTMKKEHRAFPSPLLALNGLILPAANLCCAEIFYHFPLITIITLIF